MSTVRRLLVVAVTTTLLGGPSAHAQDNGVTVGGPGDKEYVIPYADERKEAAAPSAPAAAPTAPAAQATRAAAGAVSAAKPSAATSRHPRTSAGRAHHARPLRQAVPVTASAPRSNTDDDQISPVLLLAGLVCLTLLAGGSAGYLLRRRGGAPVSAPQNES
jgi:LPXTG-motif cell wall-anchored protein